MRALIKFTHGLGDSVQLTIVLAHLKKYLPNWIVDVWALHGKHSAMRGNCSMVFSDRGEQPRESEYDQIISLSWSECHRSFSNVPSTKAALCVADVFRIDPDPSLFYYTVTPVPQAELAAEQYLRGITRADAVNGRWNVALIHYQGNTSADRKNLSHDVIADVCRWLRSRDITPVILDWDRRTPLADGVSVFCPGTDNPLWCGTGTGDAGTLAALISRARLFVGVDSGPCHVAGATDTPTIAVWTGHTPVRYFDRADNVVHLVPPNWRDSMSVEQIGVFERVYRHKARESDSLSRDIVDLACSLLSLNKDFSMVNFDSPQSAEACTSHHAEIVGRDTKPWALLRSKAYDQNYYEEHRQAGLDYLGHGEWQRAYGRWLARSLGWASRRVLDVGCACGSIMRGLGEAGIVVNGVDLSEHMIKLGREKWPDMASHLHICDAINLHLFPDCHWDGIHTGQVAEHWHPELVPFILKELARVTVPGGILFFALDTTELFARQQRTMDNEDPTHVCIQTMSWWYDQLAATGWQVCSHEYEQQLINDEESYLRQYDWDWFVARKTAT